MAEWTGLEPATTGVTGRYSNQLNYRSIWKRVFYSNFVIRQVFNGCFTSIRWIKLSVFIH
jgi:hypothetical protein